MLNYFRAQMDLLAPEASKENRYICFGIIECFYKHWRNGNGSYLSRSGLGWWDTSAVER